MVACVIQDSTFMALTLILKNLTLITQSRQTDGSQLIGTLVLRAYILLRILREV